MKKDLKKLKAIFMIIFSKDFILEIYDGGLRKKRIETFKE